MYSFFLKNILLPLGSFLFRENLIFELYKLEKIIRKDELEIKKIQINKLDKIIQYAISNTKYYKGLNISIGSNPIINLKKFPILEKYHLKNHQNDLISNKFDKDNLIMQHSSGSSGVQSIVYWTRKEMSIYRANQLMWWKWAGYKMGQPILQTGITPNRGFIKKIKDFFFRTRYVHAFTHTKNQVIDSIKWVRDKNVFLAGYPSSIYVFSKYAEKENIDVNFSGAICWGDKLFNNYKKKIDKVFGVNIKETYASAEGLMISAQNDLECMYIMTPNIYLEIVDDNGNDVPDGQMGNVLITNLNSFGMPLIRYKIGDLAVKLPRSEYPVKRKLNLPILKKVIGRDTDLVKTSSGKYMVVHSFTGIFEYFPEILQFCVVQNKISEITILIVISEKFEDTCLNNIRSKLNKYLKGELEIIFKVVESIRNTPSGKPQIIISNLK